MTSPPPCNHLYHLLVVTNHSLKGLAIFELQIGRISMKTVEVDIAKRIPKNYPPNILVFLFLWKFHGVFIEKVPFMADFLSYPFCKILPLAYFA